VNARLASDPVSALSISSQGEAVIPVTRDGRALANSPISSDGRNGAQASELENKLGVEHIYRITGQNLSAIFTLPKVMWWRDQRPEILDRAWKLLCYTDFVALRLGVEPVIDYSMAARTLGFDVTALDWSDGMLAAADLEREQLARAAPSGSLIGEIPAALAGDLGFQERVQVVTGGHDQPCAALGAGVLESGTALYSIGTTEALVAVSGKPRMELQRYHIDCYSHVAPDTYFALTGNQTGGRLLRWYRDELGAAERAIAEREGRDVYDVIVGQVDDAPGKMLLLPYFVGSGMLHGDAAASGALVGLSFNSRRADIVKAILEGLTYEQALGLRNLERAGVRIERLTAVGGGARSEKWMQIKSDITNLPIRLIHTSEAASLGVAMLAGWATGVYRDLSEAAERVIHERKTLQPRADRVPHYQRQLTRYEDLYRALKPIYQDLESEG
jgi:xylulokinase